MYDFIFVVLVYRNTKDLFEFFEGYDIPNSKVIVVNSFFDKATDEEFSVISQKNNADYITVDNKGYGYGNNRGIEYALSNYKFKYLVISNADVTILSFPNINNLLDNAITAPKITTKTGKNQNPHTPYGIEVLEKYKYWAFTKLGCKYLVVSIVINKILRYLFWLLYAMGAQKYIYAPHGAFIIIPKKVLSKLHPIFDERMFLFAEEDVLSFKAKSKDIRIVYNPKIRIYHKEDGSVSSISDKVYSIMRDSYIYYYRTYRKLNN